jgi:hypothetical protein
MLALLFVGETRGVNLTDLDQPEASRPITTLSPQNLSRIKLRGGFSGHST